VPDSTDEADLVILDAEVWTGEPQRPSARALAAKNGLLVAVGTNADAEAWVGDLTAVRSMAGAFVCPGFVDAHAHAAAMAGRLSWLRLEEASRAEVLRMVSERAKGGGWVLGRGWDESLWPDRRYLTRRELDTAAGTVPAMLVRVDGHMLALNSAALQLAQVPRGMRLTELGMDGTPSGILKEEAAVHALALAATTTEQIEAGLPEAVARLHALGITAVHDMVGGEGLEAWTRYLQRNKTLRVTANFYLRDLLGQMAARGMSSRMGDDWLRLGAAKVFADGSLGARTAALSRPYEDDRGERGFLLLGIPELRAALREAHYGAFQLAVHAIGDRAAYVVAEELASLQAPEARHRIEHFEMPGEAALDLAHEQDLVASMQPNFVGQWSQPGGLYEQRLGDRYATTNPYREVLRRGIPLCFGSDGMPYGPLYGIHSAVNAPFVEQRLSVEEALRAYTAGGAHASGDEAKTGTLLLGKFADFVALDRDPRKEPAKVREAAVTLTVVGGRVMHATRRGRPGKS